VTSLQLPNVRALPIASARTFAGVDEAETGPRHIHASLIGPRCFVAPLNAAGRLDPKDVASGQGSYENPIQRPRQATPAHRTSDITAADRATEVRSEADFVRVTWR
jgi:hypothetical protein